MKKEQKQEKVYYVGVELPELFKQFFDNVYIDLSYSRRKAVVNMALDSKEKLYAPCSVNDFIEQAEIYVPEDLMQFTDYPLYSIEIGRLRDRSYENRQFEFTFTTYIMLNHIILPKVSELLLEVDAMRQSRGDSFEYCFAYGGDLRLSCKFNTKEWSE